MDYDSRAVQGFEAGWEAGGDDHGPSYPEAYATGRAARRAVRQHVETMTDEAARWFVAGVEGAFGGFGRETDSMTPEYRDGWHYGLAVRHAAEAMEQAERGGKD